MVGTEDSVDGLAGAVFGIGPQMRVGVEGLGGAGVSQAGLDDLDRFAVADQQRYQALADEILERITTRLTAPAPVA